MVALGMHSVDASVELAERRLVVQEVEVDSVHLVPQHHVQHLHGGRRLDMRRKWSERLPTSGRLPVGGGLHTRAKAAASLCGICVQASGGVVLDCSDATDPNSTSRCLNRVEQGSSDPRAD